MDAVIAWHPDRLHRRPAELEPFIEIIEEGSTFAMSGFGGAPMGRVGRDAIESALPSVLMFELSRAL